MSLIYFYKFSLHSIAVVQDISPKSDFLKVILLF